jgi:hypothetical protein
VFSNLWGDLAFMLYSVLFQIAEGILTAVHRQQWFVNCNSVIHITYAEIKWALPAKGSDMYW